MEYGDKGTKETYQRLKCVRNKAQAEIRKKKETVGKYLQNNWRIVYLTPAGTENYQESKKRSKGIVLRKKEQ